ncbi:MAG: hypothetical protein ACM319_02925 [Deltaproteobacteria bacterium]|nr:hypothetical protein [Candidatus Deferrimicrobiaceae bacterium]
MTMYGYPVYRINPLVNDVEHIGSILEYRRSRRSMNQLGLAKLAQKIFALGPGDIIIVGSHSTLERGEISMEHTVAVSGG